jgi:hypothetical protein
MSGMNNTVEAYDTLLRTARFWFAKMMGRIKTRFVKERRFENTNST